MFSNLKLATVGALFLGLVAVTSTTARGDSTHTNYLTFSRAVALPGVELAAGTYIFENASNAMSNTIVRVSSRDRKKVFVSFTARRPASAGTTQAARAARRAPAARRAAHQRLVPVGAHHHQFSTLSSSFVSVGTLSRYTPTDFPLQTP